MACIMRKSLMTYCQRRLLQRATPILRYNISSERYKFSDAQTVGPLYQRKHFPQHEWLDAIKADLRDQDKNVRFTESYIAELEEKFKKEFNGKRGNFDLILMSTLKSEYKAKEGFQLMKYIRKRRNPSVLVLTEYMLCCNVVYPKAILEEYKTLKASLDLSTVNIGTLHSLAKVASRTSQWRDAYEMLALLQKEVEMGEDSGVLDGTVAGVLCSGIFTSNFELLLEMAYKYPEWYNRGLARGVITPALFEMWQKEKMQLDLFFELLKDMGPFLNLRDGQAQEIKAYCQSKLADKVQCELTEVDGQSGVCRQCSQKLTARDLNEEEFAMLKNGVFDKLVYGKNIYESTTPESIAHFLKFLSSSSHYDVIMDGPNVYYSRDENFWTIMKDMVQTMSTTLGKNDLKVLVVMDNFRFKHFYNPPQSLKKTVDVYRVDHRLSSDDIFMLVAAFRSGPRTYIITNDNLRNHRGRLGNPCDKLLNIWQKRYQIMHNYTSLQFPEAFDSRTHIDESGWHVPYENDIKVKRLNHAYFKDTNKFLCVKKLRPFSSAQLRAYLRMKDTFENDYKSDAIKE